MESYLNITEERSKQLLSLDALDLSLLPNTYQPWLQSDVLWKNNKFLPDQKYYFEFIIKSKSNTHDGVPTEETTHTVCYICNTAVPKAYVIEHVNSLKHISFQKIAETGLERARKYKQMIGTERLKSNLEYFCDHCVAIIYLSNRNEHEKSKTHKKFAAFDAFLNNFALFYTNNEIDIIESLPESEQDPNDVSLLKVNKVSKNSDEQNTDFEVIDLKTNCNTENTALKDKSDLEKKLMDSKALIDDIKSCLNNVTKEMNNNVAQDKYEKANVVDNLDGYIKHLKAYGTVKLHNLGSLEQDKIKIETTDGFELIVSTFNFHALRKVGKYLQCKLCECFIDNPHNHKLHEKHMIIVAQPFKDKNCIRHVQGRFSHCVLCNEVISNTIVHTKFYKHIKKLERALVTTVHNEENSGTVNIDTNDAVTPKNTEVDVPALPNSDLNKIEEIKEDININNTHNKVSSDTMKSISEIEYHCLVCNTQMHVNNVETHLNGTKHKANSSSAIYYLMDKGKNKKITCKVCDVSVNYYTWAIEDHIASVYHIENYDNCLATNKIEKTGDSFFCNPCGQKIFKINELSHIESQSHKVKLASFNITAIERNNYVKDIENKHVEVNADDVASTKIEEEPTEIHKSDADSKKLTPDLYDKDMFSEQIVEVNDANTENSNEVTNNGDAQSENKINSVVPPIYECDACNEEIPNNSSHIKVHNESVKHKTMDVLLTGVNNLLGELLKYFNCPPEIHSHLQPTDVENVLNCVVCADKVTIKDTEKHTNSLKHIHNHRKLMNANKLKLKKDKYVCYACNVYVETGKELRHIETVEHEKRMESLKNGDYVLITADNKKMIDNIHQVLKAMETESEDKAKVITFGDFIPNNKASDVTNVRHHYIDLIDNNKQLICLLCQVLVENTEYQYRIHTNDVNHEINYKTVMAYNQIFQIEDGYVCGFCECIINNEFVHISSEKHIASQKTYPKKNYCFTCKVSTDTGLKDHVTSNGHIKKIGEPSHFYCNVCNLQIAYKTNIERHNQGFEHQNNSSLIDENKVILKNKKCTCQVCETTFSRDGFEDHVNSLNHVMLLHHNYYQPTKDNCLSLHE